MSSSRRDLPGFYYDAKRNRYFPVHSRGAQNQIKNELTQENTSYLKDDCKSCSDINIKVLQSLLKREIGLASRLGRSYTSSTFKREYLETQASKPRLTFQVWSYGASSCSDGAVQEFNAQIQTNEGLKGASVVTWGNSNGLLGVCEVLPSSISNKGNVLANPEQIFPESGVKLSVDATSPPDLLPSSMLRVSSSKITAVRKLRNINDDENGTLIFTTLGSGWEGGAIFLLKQRHTYDGSWSTGQSLPLETVKCLVTDCSVWSAAYCAPSKATLGTSKGAAVVHLERSTLRWLVKSKSDVLSQECDLTGNLLFCGFRNGYISMVDMRSASARPRKMPLMRTRPESMLLPSSSLSSSFMRGKTALKPVQASKKKLPFRDKAAEVAKSFCESLRMNSAVCSLMLLQSDETYLLASAMNGDINLWDRRLVEKGPVLTYEGNQNTHSLIALGVDASESILASGGEDHAIRIWSLRSGKLLQTISGLPAVVNNISSMCQFQSSSLNYSIQDRHAWKMWLGSSAGLMYMQGSATILE